MGFCIKNHTEAFLTLINICNQIIEDRPTNKKTNITMNILDIKLEVFTNSNIVTL